ncbi:glycosyltransferase family 2 protein [Morganella morganii]|uniref:glycosyltransferase family 2 protein n=1 Tax=Morganella TaxID=581 RepID=UPI00370C6528
MNKIKSASSEFLYMASVCIITYNQENYIEHCLNSFIKQNTDFNYQIIIADDGSTDGTQLIIKELQKKHPDLIFPILQKENKGTVKNLIDAYTCATGKYIFHIDGDDYAYPNKLQEQVEILESNPDCIICTHNVNVINKNNIIIKDSFRNMKTGKYNIFDLYQCLPFFAHSSKMFRNVFTSSFWDQFNDSTLDIEVHVAQLNETNQNIYHIDKCLGAYRYFTGVSASNSRVNTAIVSGSSRIFENALIQNRQSQSLIKKAYAKKMMEYAYQSATLGNKSDYKKYIEKSVNIKIYSAIQLLFFILKPLPALSIALCKTRSIFRGYNSNKQP